MATYNTLLSELRCPHCGSLQRMEIETFFGLGNLLRYEIGSKVRWLPGKEVQNGGRPHEGNLDGEGYAECPICGKDFFVVVAIRDDTITGAQVNFGKPGFKAQGRDSGPR